MERHFFGTPGLHIAAVNAVFDPAELLNRVHGRLNSPCLFIENKLLYTAHVHSQSPDGRAWLVNDADFPTLKLDAGMRGDITLVTYGGMVPEVEEAVQRAFIEDELMVEVLVPTMIFPLDLVPIIESVTRTKRLLVVEEGQGFAGFGSEVIAACTEKTSSGNLRVGRVCAASHPIPCSRELEKNALPGSREILRMLRELVK